MIYNRFIFVNYFKNIVFVDLPWPVHVCNLNVNYRFSGIPRLPYFLFRISRLPSI